MDHLVTDLKEIARRSEKDRDDNWDFRSYLKGFLDWSDRRLDSLVHELAEEVSAQIDCTTCANCCRAMSTAATKADMIRIGKRLGMSAAEFEKQYVTSKGEYGDKLISGVPCRFLNGCLCSIYEDRPRDCRDFPHLHKPRFRSRSMSVIENASACPIVFNVLNELKRRLRWRGRR